MDDYPDYFTLDPFPLRGNFLYKSAKVVYHPPAFSLELSTYIDFGTWLSGCHGKSTNIEASNVFKKKCILDLLRTYVIHYQSLELRT